MVKESACLLAIGALFLMGNTVLAQSQSTTPQSTSSTQTAATPIQAQVTTPESLWEAARKGELEGVEQAIKAGVDVDAKTTYGATALSFAADRGHLDVVKYLLSKGADPNSKDTFYNATPMTWAMIGNRYEIMKSLAMAGATEVDTVLPQAIKQADVELLQQILDGGKASRQALKSALKLAGDQSEQESGPKMVEAVQAAMDRLFPTVTVDAATLQSYAGTYLAEGGTRLVVTFDENALMLQVTSGAKQELDATTQTEFAAQAGKLFFEVADGNVVAADFEMGGDRQRFRRLSEAEAEALPKLETTDANGGNMEVANDKFPPSSAESLAADLAISGPNWAQFRGNGARGVAEG